MTGAALAATGDGATVSSLDDFAAFDVTGGVIELVNLRLAGAFVFLTAFGAGFTGLAFLATGAGLVAFLATGASLGAFALMGFGFGRGVVLVLTLAFTGAFFVSSLPGFAAGFGLADFTATFFTRAGDFTVFLADRLTLADFAGRTLVVLALALTGFGVGLLLPLGLAFLVLAAIFSSFC